MRKILLSLLTIAGVALLAFGASQAFFSDTEVSKNNILQAGELDLEIDNTCYYNGKACVDKKWQGTDEPCSCTWLLKDLEQGDVFFNLKDLKPGDWEEDTVSIHADNDYWLCADIRVTANDDNTCTDPELDVPDLNCNDPGPEPDADLFDGELASELNFIFWVDDGDNVLECRREILPDDPERCVPEETITGGPASEVLSGAKWAIQDSEHELLEEDSPLLASHKYFIGKAFCYGKLTPNPVVENPANPNSDPTVDPGIDCDGKDVGNISQTDLLTGDILFRAEQARHNEDFLCNPPPGQTSEE